MKLNTKSLADVEVGFPIIADGVYFAQLKVDTKENKQKDGTNLVVVAKILDETLLRRDTGEEFVNKGMVLTRYVSLKETESYDPNQMLKRLALAVGHQSDDITLEDLDGQYCKVQVVYKPAADGYGDGNDIKSFFAISDEDDFNPPA